MKLGLYGGSFDPIHFGHLILAREAMEQLQLNRVVFIPAAISPFKLNRTPAPAGVRMKMVCDAVADEEGFDVSDCELCRPGPSFTIDTVRQFGREFPDAELFLLIGDDNLPDLHAWREIDALRRLARLVVLSRGTAVQPPPGMLLVHRSVEISSTEIRNRVAHGQSIRYLLPMSACETIQENGLYLHD